MKQAACVLVIQDGEVLAVSRKNDHTAMGFPGGKVDDGESVVECAVRELREETGLVVDAFNLELIFQGTDAAQYEVASFLVKNYVPYRNGVPRSIECQRVEFVPWSELTSSTATWQGYNRLVQAALERHYSIPEVSRRHVEHVLGWIRPVVSFEGEKRYIRKCGPFDVAYTWAAKPRWFSASPGLTEVARIRTLHRYGYHGFFKPSLAEVVAQIPADLVHEIDAFEIVAWPQTVTELNQELYALNRGYHVATTALYKTRNSK